MNKLANIYSSLDERYSVIECHYRCLVCPSTKDLHANLCRRAAVAFFQIGFIFLGENYSRYFLKPFFLH